MLLMITIIVSSQQVYADSGYCGDDLIYNKNIKWELDEAGVLTLTGEGLMRTYFKEYDVPWYEIKDQIKEVRVGEGIRLISIWVFRDAVNLEKVTLTKDLEIIGAGAFYGCESLTEVSLKENVKDIGSYTFYGCKNLNTITNSDFIRVMEVNNYLFQEIN